MPKRSITNGEIALIKALLARKTRNKDIQFFFNRPDRAVNSGRITGIRKGTYSDSVTIPAADDATLDAFLESKMATVAEDVAVAVPAAIDVAPEGPLSEKTIRSLFRRGTDGLWRLIDGESDEHESKRSFSFKHSTKWLRAVASLANNKGGYVLFGVHDKEKIGSANIHLSEAVVGLLTPDFATADASKFTELLRATFDPTPEFKVTTCTFEEAIIGVIYVFRHPARPVIARCNHGDEIKEGDILYRYPGQSRRIKYSDLRTLLDDRDRSARENILPMVERLLALGPHRAMIADLDEGELTDGRTSITIDPALVDSIDFIREGEFDEVAGAPVLRIVGDVRVGEDATPVVVKGPVSRSDVLRSFLVQERVADPEGYARFILDSCAGNWLPLRYYLTLAGFDQKKSLEFIDSCKIRFQRRTHFRHHVISPDHALQYNGYHADLLLDRILAGEIQEILHHRQAIEVARAVHGLRHGALFDRSKLLEQMRKCLEVADLDLTGNAGSAARRAIARIDQVLYPLT